MSKLQKISDRVYMSDLGGVVQFTTATKAQFSTGTVQPVRVGNVSGEIMYNGATNDLPQNREKLIRENAYLPNLHAVQRNLLLGDEFIAYRKIKEAGVTRIEEVDFPTRLTDKFPLDFIKIINEAIANEYVKHAAAYPQFVWKKDNTIEVEGVKVLKTIDIRAERQNPKDGLIKNWYWSNYWLPQIDTVKEPVMYKIPAWDRAMVRDQKNTTKWKQRSFVFPIQDMLQNDGYYPIAAVDGVRDAVELSNAVWVFHKSNLQNGYNMRWHITIPEDYFFDYESVDKGLVSQDDAVKNAKSAEQDFIDKMNEFLAGVQNAGRAIYTKKRVAMEKEYPGIEIKALDYDMKDEALLKLEQRAMVATLSNQGVPPILASVQLPEGFGSGSQIRGILGMYQIVNLPFLREKVYSWLNVLKMTEGLPADIYYGAKDRELTSLDANPTGSQKTTGNN